MFAGRRATGGFDSALFVECMVICNDLVINVVHVFYELLFESRLAPFVDSSNNVFITFAKRGTFERNCSFNNAFYQFLLNAMLFFHFMMELVNHLGERSYLGGVLWLVVVIKEACSEVCGGLKLTFFTEMATIERVSTIGMH